MISSMRKLQRPLLNAVRITTVPAQFFVIFAAPPTPLDSLRPEHKNSNNDNVDKIRAFALNVPTRTEKGKGTLQHAIPPSISPLRSRTAKRRIERSHPSSTEDSIANPNGSDRSVHRDGRDRVGAESANKIRDDLKHRIRDDTKHRIRDDAKHLKSEMI